MMTSLPTCRPGYLLLLTGFLTFSFGPAAAQDWRVLSKGGQLTQGNWGSWVIDASSARAGSFESYEGIYLSGKIRKFSSDGKNLGPYVMVVPADSCARGTGPLFVREDGMPKPQDSSWSREGNKLHDYVGNELCVMYASMRNPPEAKAAPGSTAATTSPGAATPPLYGAVRVDYTLPEHTVRGIKVTMRPSPPGRASFTIQNRTDLAAATLTVRCASASNAALNRTYVLKVGTDNGPLQSQFVLPDSETSRVSVLDNGTRVTTESPQLFPWTANDNPSCTPVAALLPSRSEVDQLNAALRQNQNAQAQAQQNEFAKYSDPVAVMARAAMSVPAAEQRCAGVKSNLIEWTTLVRDHVKHFGIDRGRRTAYEQVQLAKAQRCLPEAFP